MGAGAVVAGRRLVAPLGRGGEGEVWEAERPDGTPCALKVIRPEVLAGSDDVRRRGRWLVRIDHPALVRVTRGGRFTAGDLAGWGFVEMDLVTGESLATVGPVPDALEALADVAEALDLLHAGAWSDGVPLVHRDVKPGNLIATRDGLVLVDPSTMRGLDTTDLTRVGTPAYLAPEVVTGRFGPLADVHSLAATGIALLTGLRAHALTELLAELREDPAGHDLPGGLLAGVATDPARRPGTCAAVVDPRSRITVAPPSDPVVHEDPRQPTLLLPVDDIHRHPDDPVDDADARLGWPLAALAVVLLTPSVAWALGGDGAASVMVGVFALATVLHLIVHVVTGRAALALFAPPWAWGDLLAGLDDAGDDRGRWLADTVAGLLLLGSSAVGLAVVEALPRWTPLAVVLVVLLLIVVVAAHARTAGRFGWARAWTLWLPVRLVGAVPRVVVSGGRR